MKLAMLAGCVLAGVAMGQNQPPAGSALQFNGTNTNVRIEDHPLLDLSRAATFEMWVNPSSNSASGVSELLSKSDGWDCCSNRSYEFGFDSVGTGFTFFWATGSVAGNWLPHRYDSTNPPIGQWTHLALTLNLDQNSALLYRNGVQVGSLTLGSYSGLRNSSMPLWLGGRVSQGAYWFNGALDELRIWNVVRTPAQIAANYNTTVPTNSPGLVAYYSFDEGTGTTVQDRTGNGLDGAVNGGATWVQVVPPCTAPSITTQPIAQSVCSGAALNLSVTATGTSPQFQWRRNGTNISGATSATYTVLNAGAVNAGSYDCVISNSCGTVTSNAVSVTINSAPSITTQPVALPLTPGSNASFSITAQGSGLTYQWRRNGVALTSSGRVGGATTSSLSIASVTSSDQGNYDCIVTGTCGAITSSAASLSCTPIFTQQPQGGVFQGGSTITLSTIVSTSGSTTYRWRKNGVPLFNSPLFSGTTSPALTISANDPNVSGEYTLSVTNACGTTLSAAASVTVTCLADVNNDGNVDGDDVIEFFASWDAGLAGGDINEDGSADGDDVIALFDRWDRGC